MSSPRFSIRRRSSIAVSVESKQHQASPCLSSSGRRPPLNDSIELQPLQSSSPCISNSRRSSINSSMELQPLQSSPCLSSSRRSSIAVGVESKPHLKPSSRRASVSSSSVSCGDDNTKTGHTSFSGRDRLEKYASVFTGSPTLNNFYGNMLSKTLRYRQSKGYTTEKFNAHEVYPNLYVGDVYAAHNVTELKGRGFTHIVNCVPGVQPAFASEFKYLYIPMLDCPTESISDQFNDSFNFIHDALSNHGVVLVHCLQGMSRSATIASSYVMKAMHVPAREAVSILQSRRSIIKPNYGFMRQLEQYEKEMNEIRKEEITAHKKAAEECSDRLSSPSPIIPPS